MKGAPVDHKLSVLVQIDLDDRGVRLVVTGCLTERNHHVLHPLIRRARTLAPPVTVTVDLTRTEHVEAIAVDLLRWAIDHDTSLGPVEILSPAPLPQHRHRGVLAAAPAGPPTGAWPPYRRQHEHSHCRPLIGAQHQLGCRGPHVSGSGR